MDYEKELKFKEQFAFLTKTITFSEENITQIKLVNIIIFNTLHNI